MNRAIRTFVVHAASGALLAVAASASAEDAEASLGRLTPRAAEVAKLAAQSLLLDVARAGDALIAVGDRGHVLRSTDGEQWTQIAVPVHATLTAVSFADARHGWAVGHDGAILLTGDGGVSWMLQRFEPAQNQPLLDVIALDTNHAVAVGAYGLMLRTADGGTTWTPAQAPALLEEGLHLNAVVRLGNGSVLVVGETGLMGVSADGGASWTRLTSPYDGSLFGALPVGQGGALVFGLRGNVLRSDDVLRGEWARVDLGSVLSVYGGTIIEDGSVVLVGADGAIFTIAADGRVQQRQLDIATGTLSGGSLTGALPWKQDLLVIGEAGFSTVRSGAPQGP